MTAIGNIGSALKLLKGAAAIKNVAGAVLTKGFTRNPSRLNKATLVFVTSGANKGAPTSDATNDSPGRLGALCWDSSNDDWYVCSSYTADDEFTWTKIVD